MPIRQKVLWPNKYMDFCKVEGDEIADHYGVYVDDLLVCVASIYITKNRARLRKFAILKEFQGKGIGTKLIHHILEKLKIEDIEYFWCDARKDAIGFYEKFEMKKIGDIFFKFEVSYYKMQVKI